MEEPTIETAGRRVSPGAELSAAQRAGAWFYTGPAGRLVSFSIDLTLSLAALAVWSTRRVWQRVRGRHSAA